MLCVTPRSLYTVERAPKPIEQAGGRMLARQLGEDGICLPVPDTEQQLFENPAQFQPDRSRNVGSTSINSFTTLRMVCRLAEKTLDCLRNLYK